VRASSGGITRSILHAVGASAQSAWAGEAPKAWQQQRRHERGKGAGTRARGEAAAAHSAARAGSRRMMTDEPVAITAEASDSKSIGLAGIHTCHGSGTSGEVGQSRVYATM